MSLKLSCSGKTLFYIARSLFFKFKWKTFPQNKNLTPVSNAGNHEDNLDDFSVINSETQLFPNYHSIYVKVAISDSDKWKIPTTIQF